MLRKEYGTFVLTNEYDSPFEELAGFFLATEDVERALDCIEISLNAVELAEYEIRQARKRASDFIDEVNTRFREHGIGFRYESGKILRVDSEFLYSETIKPVLRLLAKKNYRGVDEEFRTAHEHYRHGRYRESILACSQALESMMKILCARRRLEIPKSATAIPLAKTLIEDGLLPAHFQSQLSCIPSLRNQYAAHGHGAERVVIPRWIAEYQIHLTATTILLLDNADKASSAAPS